MKAIIEQFLLKQGKSDEQTILKHLLSHKSISKKTSLRQLQGTLHACKQFKRDPDKLWTYVNTPSTPKFVSQSAIKKPQQLADDDMSNDSLNDIIVSQDIQPKIEFDELPNLQIPKLENEPDPEQFLVKPPSSTKKQLTMLNKKHQENILAQFNSLEPPKKRIKLTADTGLNELTKEYGSATVLGMLQAFILLKPILAEKITARERNIIMSLTQPDKPPQEE